MASPSQPTQPPQPPAIPAALRTAFSALCGIDFPIVQTGMGWVAGARLAAATSAAGGLGIVASATMTYDELARAVADVKDRTDRPFGVNLRSNHVEIDRFANLLVTEQVRVASFAQAPGERLVKRLRDAGVVTMPTVAARRHAEKMAGFGVGALIAQGHEGGGHTGSVPTSLLLPQVVDAVDVPVLGAGGFFDGRGLVAALAVGAAGVAMGTRFLLTTESSVPDRVKQRYLQASVLDTVVTRAVDGVPQRLIRTDLVDGLERGPRALVAARAVANALRLRRLTSTSLPALLREGLAMRSAGGLSLAEVAMAANAPMLTRAAMVEGRLEAGILPAGQVTGVIAELPSVAELIGRIVGEAVEVLERLGVPARGPSEAR